MAKNKASIRACSNEDPVPTLPDFESFHVTASKEISKRVVKLLREAGIRLSETVWHEIGRAEYVIEVHRDDLAKAGKTFAKELGPSRTVTSKVPESDASS